MTSTRDKQRRRATAKRANKLRTDIQKANKILKSWRKLHGPLLIPLREDASKENLAAWLIIATRCGSVKEAEGIMKAVVKASIKSCWELVAITIKYFTVGPKLHFTLRE